MFSTSQEIQKYLSGATNALSLETIQPMLRIALRTYIIPYISEKEYKKLEQDYLANTADEIRLKAIELLQETLVYFAFYKHKPYANMYLSDAGTKKVSNGDFENMAKWEDVDIKNATIENAYNALESLLELLATNLDSFPDYKASNNYATYQQNFLQSAQQFGMYLSIDKKHLLFQRLKHLIAETERIKLQNIVGTNLFAALQNRKKNATTTQKDNELSNNYIQPYIVYELLQNSFYELPISFENGFVKYNYATSDGQTTTQATANELANLQVRYREKADTYASLLITYLQENVADFPEFMTAKSYKPPTTQPQETPLNSPTNKYFSF